MNIADIVVVTAATVLLARLGWFFFGPRRARTARVEDGVQRIVVTVGGGYSPDVIRVRQGVTVELAFDRQESGDCTSQVLSPNCTSPRRRPPMSAPPSGVQANGGSTFVFACRMNMIHGTLIVHPAENPGYDLSPHRGRCRPSRAR